MAQIYTSKNIIDLYLKSPVVKIVLSHANDYHDKQTGCSYEPPVKRLRRGDNIDATEEEDLVKGDNIYKDVELDTVLGGLIKDKKGPLKDDFMTPIRPTKKDMYEKGWSKIDLVSPESRKIINRLDESEALRYIQDYIRENEIAQIIQNDIDIRDPDFTYSSSSEVGVLLEYWVCANMKCPICEGELHKYALTNMPVIDVKCSNDAHTFNMGPKYFQIKATESNSNGLLYFTLKRFLDNMNGFITVGSRRAGIFSHNVKPSRIVRGDTTSMNLLIGYICIEYTYYSANNRNIKLNLHNSFILLPQTKIKRSLIKKPNNYYYEYIDTITGKPTIKYNPEFVQMLRFKSLIGTNIFNPDIFSGSSKQIIVNLDTKYDEIMQTPETINVEPVSKKQMSFANADKVSYLTAKLKYLILKDIIN